MLPSPAGTFEQVVLPHLDAGYRLARWLMRGDQDAEYVVQEALRAVRSFRTFPGGNGRAWFLGIVRNACWRRHGRTVQAVIDPFEEERSRSVRPVPRPEVLSLKTDDGALIERALLDLPDRFRELIVLRELEGLSYGELGHVLGIPIGTVMSNLSRARQAFGCALDNQLKQSVGSTNPSSREREADAVTV